MKKILSLLGFCVLAFHGFGQAKKIEKRSYGLLDSVYYVNGGDTVCVETYYGNGLVEGRFWKNDSTEQFDRNGRLMSRTQNHIKHEKLPSFWGIDILHKNTKFYPNGLIMYESKWQGDTMWTEQTFEPNGKVISQHTRGETRSSDGQSVNFYSNTFDEENLVETEITDTLHKLNIEKYYNKNEKIIKIKTRKINDFQVGSYLSYVFYDDNEKIEYKWSLDSNRLNADKDNGDCMYGFRDLRGNWVIPPQYDNVKRFNMSYYIVNKNEKYGVIDDFGKTILPLDFDFLGILGVGMSEEISLGQVYNNVYKPRSSVALRCRMGNKYGVVDFMGKVLLPPQYDDVRKMQNDTFEVQIGKKWGLVDSKGRIIVQPIYDKVNFTKLSTFFEVIDTLERQGTNYKIVHEIKGLINDKGKVFLDRKFEELNQELNNPNIFLVKSYNKNVEFVNDLREGIFNINKGWLFDTAYHFQNDDICQFYKRHPLYKDSIEATLYGCVNEKYEIILPFEYDFIESFTKTQYNPDSCTGGHTGSCSTNNTFFICKKDGKFGVFDKQKALWQIPLIYDYIHCFKIDYTRIEEYKPYENIVRLLVLKDGNWQWIDERGTPLSDDLIDYAGIYENGCFTVKNNIITNHNGDFYPNNEPLERIKNDKSETQSEFIYFKDFKDRELLVNSKGKMAVPPQYFIISSFGKYTIAKDSAKKQWLFDIEGNKRPFLQQYKIILAQINEGIIIVKDTLRNTFGVVSPEGKTIIPIQYYAISALDKSNIIWAKTTKLGNITYEEEHKFNIKTGYVLSPNDNGWVMFDNKGKQLSKTVFAFPFDIHTNHGIGVIRQNDNIDYKVGLWRNDGKNLLPPQYDRIFFDTYNRLYHIYKNENLGVKVGVCDTTGRILIEPKFDKMGTFNGEYALVEDNGNCGVVMRNGQYKISSQKNAFKNTPYNIEALLIEAKNDEENKEENESYNHLGVRKFGFDYRVPNSLYKNHELEKLEKTRFNTLKNLLTEKTLDGNFIKKENIPFSRTSTGVFSDSDNLNASWAYFSVLGKIYSLTDYYADENTICFILGEANNNEGRSCSGPQYKHQAFNFRKDKNKQWEEVTIEDLIDLNPDNSFKINQLIIDKIRNIKNGEIDCSNSTAYFEQVKGKYYIQPNGLLFFMSGSWIYRNSRYNNVEILLTWDELKPYLKKKE